MSAVTLTLPTLPPSANNLFATGKDGRRHISKAYKLWRNSAGWHLKVQVGSVRRFNGNVSVTYEVGRPNDRRCRDLANYEKALSDLLVKHGVLKDDSNIVDLRMRWIAGDGVHITVKEASP